MKIYIVVIASFFLNMFFLIDAQDYNLHQRHMFQLKFVAGEVAAAGAQYYDIEEYSEGRKIFNKEEGLKAAEYILECNLKVNMDTRTGYWKDSHTYIGYVEPEPGSYAQEIVTYVIEFIDETHPNYTIPFLYSHDSSMFTQAIGDPTVVVTIDTGKPRYRLIKHNTASMRTSFHEWQEWK